MSADTSKEKRCHPGRAEALRLLTEMADEFDALRICQIIANAISFDLFYVEDRELVLKLRECRDWLRRQSNGRS